MNNSQPPDYDEENDDGILLDGYNDPIITTPEQDKGVYGLNDFFNQAWIH